jgi:cytochrome c oxidase cbb3-type subunit III
MSSPCGSRGAPRVPALRLAALLAAAVLTGACDREERRLRESPPGRPASADVRLSVLRPGARADTAAHAATPYEDNAYAVSEGQRLFGWYNCAGCHANGGGGMGPPLMDDRWVYGSAPEQVYATIVQGRPNGMPSFAGRIPTTQVWQLVAYVRSLSALNSPNARAARSDNMMAYPTSQVTRRAERPAQSFRPPAAEMP